jgi:hypothetical protein
LITDLQVQNAVIREDFLSERKNMFFTNDNSSK